MSIQKVERKVDTVIIEMDVSNAEQLLEILNLVHDGTSYAAASVYGSAMSDLRVRLEEDADVRYPSPLYRAEMMPGYVLLRNILTSEREAMRR